MPKSYKPEFFSPSELKQSTSSEPYQQPTFSDIFEHESFTMRRPVAFSQVPEGTHDAEVLKLHQTTGPSFDDPTVMIDKVVVLIGTEYGTMQRTMNLKFNENSVLSKFLSAVLGDVPAEINSDDLVGKKLRVTVIHKEKNGNTYANITDWKRAKGA